MKIRLLILLTSILCSQNNYAQIFDIEQANSNIKWKQINTPSFQLIFPEKFSTAAKGLARTVDIQLKQSNVNMQRKAKKISIVVQENTLEQNGFVQLAPRKSEVYATPSGIADNQSWLSNLTLHEMRHVAQFDNLTGKIHKPYGEQIALGLFALNLPSWYFEGDAVLHETLFSAGGRGRLSSWQMPIRANIQANLDYDFNKYVHGSFKDIVPSYYTIGYFLNSEIYEKSPSITADIFEDMRNKLLRPFNFQHALKQHYGAKSSQLFEQTITNLKDKWAKKTENNYPNRILLKDKYPSDYTLPQVENGSIYALQEGPQRVPRIVQIPLNNPDSLVDILTLGAQIMPYFHIKNHLIVWDEYRRNARYSKETFNVINVYNILSKEKKTITYETRYFTPALSPDLKNIVCVEVDEANNSYLTILDVLTGKKIKSIPAPKNIHIQQPQYHPNGQKIITIGVSESGTNLLEFDLADEKITARIAWANQQIERPIYYKNDLIFKSNLDNKDDIFKLEQGEILRLTNVEYGAFNPFVHENILFFNDYTPRGLKINHVDLDTVRVQKISPQVSQTLYASQNTFKIPTEPIDSTTAYTITDYSSLLHTVNFHSISISGNDFESFDNLKPGLFLLSNDVLNTTQAKLGIEYDTNIKKTSYSAELSYQKYYPKITLGYKNRGLIGTASASNDAEALRNFDFRENLVTADIQLPFVKFRGNTIYAYGVTLGTSYQYRYNTSIANLKNFNTEIAFPLNYQLYLNRNSRRSRMDIFPRWGQNLSFIYRHLPFEKKLDGSSWSLRTSLYFPGFALNHGFQLRYSMQENTGRFTGSNDIPLIDGITYIAYKRIKNTLLLDYRLPLMYPDFSIGQLAYVKRVYGGLSANYLNIHESSSLPQSIGASLYFDFNLLKYNLPNFTIETKVNYLTAKNSTRNIIPVFSFNYTY